LSKQTEEKEKQRALQEQMTTAYFAFASSAAASLNSISSSIFAQQTQNLQAEKDAQIKKFADYDTLSERAKKADEFEV